MNYKQTAEIHLLALLYGVQTAYYGVKKRRQMATAESLLGALRALGAPVSSFDDVSDALRERRQSLLRRIVEPVVVAWDGRVPTVEICLPARSSGAVTGRLEMESGKIFEWKWRTDDFPPLRREEDEGVCYEVRQLTIPQGLPPGYHRLCLETGAGTRETLIISAPFKTFTPGREQKGWGAFLPLYALRTAHGWGTGDYTGLEQLAAWTAGMGGNLVASLPLLPTFLDGPFEPSPYAPVSRLLWNELYIEITKAAEMISWKLPADYKGEIDHLRRTELVDYRGVAALKRRALREMSRVTEGNEELEKFGREHPHAAGYARFRAVMDRRGQSWREWPEDLGPGSIKEDHYDEADRRYHLFAQWLAHRQVNDMLETSRRKGVSLYFDLPLGVHPDGYDVWRNREIFTLGATAGAPPDSVFTWGQNWFFPPLHPERIREQGYRYVIEYLRHHMANSDMLRIDHVMGLHRLYWIPQGLGSHQGVYVRYRPDELYAIMALESCRNRCVIVGEDLGIVPGYVRPAMSHHGLHRMYILHYELLESGTLRKMPRDSIAGLNTHDMPPFAAFWEETDIDERRGLGLLDDKGVARERRDRRRLKKTLCALLRGHGILEKGKPSTFEVLKACLAYLGGGASRTALVNLEDLWLEKRSQNYPATGDRYASWRGRSRYALEEFDELPQVREVLEMINRARKKR